MIAPPENIRNAVLGGLVGAALGALIVAALMIASLGPGQPATDSSELVPWLSTIVLVIVAQFAVAGALCATAFAEAEPRRGT